MPLPHKSLYHQTELPFEVTAIGADTVSNQVSQTQGAVHTIITGSPINRARACAVPHFRALLGQIVSEHPDLDIVSLPYHKKTPLNDLYAEVNQRVETRSDQPFVVIASNFAWLYDGQKQVYSTLFKTADQAVAEVDAITKPAAFDAHISTLLNNSAQHLSIHTLDSAVIRQIFHTLVSQPNWSHAGVASSDATLDTASFTELTRFVQEYVNKYETHPIVIYFKNYMWIHTPKPSTLHAVEWNDPEALQQRVERITRSVTDQNKQ